MEKLTRAPQVRKPEKCEKNRKAEHNTRLFCIVFGVIEKYSLREEQLVAKLMDVENTTPTITSSRVAKAICEIKPSYKKEELNITN